MPPSYTDTHCCDDADPPSSPSRTLLYHDYGSSSPSRQGTLRCNRRPAKPEAPAGGDVDEHLLRHAARELAAMRGRPPRSFRKAAMSTAATTTTTVTSSSADGSTSTVTTTVVMPAAAPAVASLPQSEPYAFVPTTYGAVATTKVTLKEGVMDTVFEFLTGIDVTTWTGLVRMRLIKLDENTCVTVAMYDSPESMASNAENVKAALGDMAKYMAAPPERYIGKVNHVESEQPINSWTTLKLKEGSVDAVLKGCRAFRISDGTWPGLISMKVSAADTNTVLTTAKYTSVAAMEALAPKVKQAFADFASCFSEPPIRHVVPEMFGFSDVKTYNSTVVLTVKPGSMADVTDIFMKTLIGDGICAQINGLVNYHWYQVDETTLISSAVYRSKAHCEATAAFYAEKLTELKKFCTSVDRLLGETVFDYDI